MRRQIQTLRYMTPHDIIILIVDSLFKLKLQGMLDQEDMLYVHDDFILKFKYEWKVFSDSYEGTYLFNDSSAPQYQEL